MNPEQAVEKDELVTAVLTLITEVRDLNKKLAYYAPRDEVQRDGRKRGWQFLAFAVAIILVAQGLTMTTISYCFLNVNTAQHAPCTAMPGYGEALEQAEIRNKRFELLLTTIEVNKVEIARLNEEVDKLKKENR